MTNHPTTPAPITSGDALKTDILAVPTAIMNLPSDKGPANREFDHWYKLGHRDARHAAAELVLAKADELAALATRATDAPAQGEATPLADLWIHEDMDRDAMASALNAPRKDLKAAHQQVVEDLLHWRRRAMEAEAKRAAQGEQVQVPSGERDRFAAWWRDRVPATDTSQHAEAFAFEVWRAAIAQRAGAADKPAYPVPTGAALNDKAFMDFWFADHKPVIENIGLISHKVVHYIFNDGRVAATADAAPACRYPVCQPEAEQQRIADEVHRQLYTGDAAPAGAVADCTGPCEHKDAPCADCPYTKNWDGDQDDAAAEVTPAPQCNLSASSLEAQGCKERAPAEGDPHVNSLFHRMQAAAGIMSGPASTLDEMAEYIIDALQSRSGAPATAAESVPDGVLIGAYRLERDPLLRIEWIEQIDRPALWAVRRNGDCLNKQGEWEYEPLPSSRDNGFRERCRFATADEAIQAALAKVAADAQSAESGREG